ncbi:MAG: branched-chain amino acid transaminase [Anaerolineales bacterium]
MALPRFAYFEGRIVPYSEAHIGVATHAFNYGTAAFGGMRAYWNAENEQLYLFRPIDHFTRLLNSAKILAADLPYTPANLTEITLELLRTEGFREDAYVRPIIYKADEIIGVKLHNLRDAITIFSVPFGKYLANDTGAHVTISSWRRIDDNMIPARAKINGAYVNSALIKTDALRAGFDEALVLTEDGHISEGSAMNVFVVRNGQLITPPITDNILEGITRRSVMELAAAELKLPVIERSIDRTEIYLCDEIFMTGTAAQVTAVTRVDHRPIGDGKMGPITTRLRELFNQVVRGAMPAYQSWLTPVYA